MAQHILDEDAFPIVGWAGPGGEMIREDVMAGMAEAGFTVSHSGAGGDLKAVKRALDVAADAGVRLLLVHPSYHYLVFQQAGEAGGSVFLLGIVQLLA